MIGELLSIHGAVGAFLLSLFVFVFGLAPGPALAVIVRLIPDPDRRQELQAELYEVPRWERPYWVLQQLEVAARIGLGPRLSWNWGRYVRHRCRLESGVERHRQYPASFEIPSEEDKGALRPGDTARLMWSVKRSPGERMWVTITERRGDEFVGTLKNWAIFAYLSPGETVKFHADHIIDFHLFDEQVGAVSDQPRPPA